MLRILTPDPYATFVITSPGNGYISWAADTPAGYVAPLLLGVPFEGSGYSINYNYEKGTIWYYWEGRSGQVGQYVDITGHSPATHTFYATAPVPEPASLLALLSGIGGMAAFGRRRSRA